MLFETEEIAHLGRLGIGASRVTFSTAHGGRVPDRLVGAVQAFWPPSTISSTLENPGRAATLLPPSIRAPGAEARLAPGTDSKSHESHGLRLIIHLGTEEASMRQFNEDT